MCALHHHTFDILYIIIFGQNGPIAQHDELSMSRGVCSLQRHISDSNMKVLYMRTVDVHENLAVSMCILEREISGERAGSFEI